MSLSVNTSTPGPKQIGAALVLLRITSAAAFLCHGSGILFGAFGGPGPEQFAASHHWPVALVPAAAHNQADL
ncbi:MAG TPA: hypothetical protein VF772_14840, partial [Terriglobales bacterium]